MGIFETAINYGMHDGGYARSERNSLYQAKGAAFHGGNGSRTWDRCTVVAVNPSAYTCTVYTETGQYLQGVPFPSSGGVKVPETGSEQYAVHYNLGYPQLMSSSHAVQAAESAEDSFSIAGVTSDVGTNSTVYGERGSGQHRGNKPNDANPGDWFQLGEDGNLIGVLSGGAVLMKASELAQIIMTQAHHLVRIMGKNIRMDTGMGHLDLNTNDGKSTLELRIGADEETEGGPDAENFRIRADLGTEGELVDFRVTDGKGRSVYRMYVDPDGRVESLAESVEDVVKKDRVEITGGVKKTTVGASLTETVGEGVTRTVGGSIKESCNGFHTQHTGGDRRLGSGRDTIIESARNIRVSATGSPTDPGSDAVEVNVANGDFSINIGQVENGDLQLKKSGFNVKTLTGDIQMTSRLGNITLDTTLPSSVKLGGPGPGLFGAVLHEFFAQIINTMNILFDTHVHPVLALGGIPTGPPLVPTTPIIAPFLPLSKSMFVTYGG